MVASSSVTLLHVVCSAQSRASCVVRLHKGVCRHRTVSSSHLHSGNVGESAAPAKPPHPAALPAVPVCHTRLICTAGRCVAVGCPCDARVFVYMTIPPSAMHTSLPA